MAELAGPLRELRLVFRAAGDGTWAIRLEDQPKHVVGAAASLTPFLDDGDYEDLRWYLEDYMDLPDGGAVVRAQGVEQKLGQWGRRLHDMVFGVSENAALLVQLLAAPEPRGLTIASDESVLLRLPWELMADAAGSLAHRLAVRRQLAEPESLVPREVQLPLRILYIVSRPADAGFIDPRLTTRALFGALDPLQGHVRLDFCRPPTVGRMEEMLREAQSTGNPYDIVHFDGHGNFLPESQIGALCFERPDDGGGESRTDHVRADRLGDLLAQYKVPLVVLEACRSATIGKAAVFRSVAPRLIRAGVGSVLSMGHAVHVEAARLLLDRFYRELAGGATIGHAVAQGRAALRASPARWIEYGPGGRSVSLQDWFLPHLYQRGVDDRLLAGDERNERPVRPFDLFLSHNHNDSSRVEALARTISDKHKLRVWLDKWECGPGPLEPQCERGIRESRFTVVAGSQKALDSRWVAWEIARHIELNPERDRLLPVKLERLELPPGLGELLWVDATDPARDDESAALVSRLVRSTDAHDARRRRGFRPPPERGQPGAFPEPPRYGFHGRARELHALERHFRRDRGIVLHAMGGMGKTTLATEAADWWTRGGLFRDGACFASFERTMMDAARVVSVLGEYCEGPGFHQRPATEQRRRAVEFMRERAVLMVWDNFESVLPAFHADAAAHDTPYTDVVRRELGELFHDLTQGPGQGGVLVTCRPGETGLPGAKRVELRGLARADSLWLLHRILERGGGSLDDPRLAKERLEPLLDDLADHPLSLELVGPHLRTLTPEQVRTDFAQLVATMSQESDQDRNRSLLASLEFSRRHLSEEARAALPWLGLFRGGVFEDNLLDVAQIEPAKWESIRSQLVDIALLRVEGDATVADRPFLRFHPTLAIASTDVGLAARAEVRTRFVATYIAMMRSVDEVLKGNEPRAALIVLDREEMNWRTAVRFALADGRQPAAAALGDTFQTYLERSGRLRERDGWVKMLRDAMAQGDFTVESAAYEREHAWALFSQGDPAGALMRIRALLERLRRTTEFDPAFQLATTTLALGRILVESGNSAEAIPVLQNAIDLFEQHVSRERSTSTAGAANSHGSHNLTAARGDLANALRDVGRHAEALAVAKKCLDLSVQSGSIREVAVGHGQCASILRHAGRYDEADSHYGMALAAARQAGDKDLEGTTLQHQGLLARERNQPERAASLYQQALQRFLEVGNDAALMRTYNLLGVLETQAGRLAAGGAWFGKSRELAVKLQDRPGIASAAQNIGIARQHEGEVARARGDEVTARRCFEEARRFVEEGREVWREQRNKPHEAASTGQLARIHLRLGELDAAERHAHTAREIHESLGLKEAELDYATLAEVAAARADAATRSRNLEEAHRHAANGLSWARKRDELRAELDRRAGHGDALPDEMLRALEALTQACVRAGFGGETIHPQAEEALAKLDKFPAPYPEFSAVLRRLAAGELPPIPATLPKRLHALLEGLVAAIRGQAQ